MYVCVCVCMWHEDKCAPQLTKTTKTRQRRECDVSGLACPAASLSAFTLKHRGNNIKHSKSCAHKKEKLWKIEREEKRQTQVKEEKERKARRVWSSSGKVRAWKLWLFCFFSLSLLSCSFCTTNVDWNVKHPSLEEKLSS